MYNFFVTSANNLSTYLLTLNLNFCIEKKTFYSLKLLEKLNEIVIGDTISCEEVLDFRLHLLTTVASWKAERTQLKVLKLPIFGMVKKTYLVLILHHTYTNMRF